ncbi:hypothetical protein MBLNU230_g2301t1 [Neophaeotheca triangularis]
MDAHSAPPQPKPISNRTKGLNRTLGAGLTQQVHGSRVLLVGAGGIGCEVLKNLVCCGFGSPYNGPLPQNGFAASPPARKPEIVVVDLDTIDLSNLNRQFLFRKQHIKQPKATVAKETASRFNPSVTIDARHGSIFDNEYDVEFFEGFDVVFNALDNLAARRHVNKMCLAANVPLIESGTTGFNGQVQAIQKGVTECYDCNPKPVQKSFPICTIRSTPSQPIHCIVWAKSYLFPELFGTSEEDSADMSVTEGDNAEEVAKLKEESQALKKIRSMMGTEGFAEAVFDKVFYDDIERLRSMEEMWQSRTPPNSLRFMELGAGSDLVRAGQALSSQDQSTWTPQENLAVFCYSLDILSSRMQAGESVIEFDKDDKGTLDFVASAANLRSLIFSIPLHSEWSIKQMAGNIIPAIATSNALTASLCVLQSFKILRSQTAIANGAMAKATANNHLPNASAQLSTNKLGGALLGGSKMVFLTSKHTERMIATENLSPPNPHCPVCSPVYAKLQLPSPATPPTLQALVTLLRDHLNYEDFSITTSAGLIYDPDLEDNLPQTLSSLGIDPQTPGFITVTDDADEPKVDLVLSYSTTASDTLTLIPSALSLPLKPAKPAAPEPRALPANGDNGDVQPATTQKRKRSHSPDELEGAKRAKEGNLKTGGEKAEEVFVVEDDGAILLDD